MMHFLAHIRLVCVCVFFLSVHTRASFENVVQSYRSSCRAAGGSCLKIICIEIHTETKHNRHTQKITHRQHFPTFTSTHSYTRTHGTFTTCGTRYNVVCVTVHDAPVYLSRLCTWSD